MSMSVEDVKKGTLFVWHKDNKVYQVGTVKMGGVLASRYTGGKKSIFISYFEMEVLDPLTELCMRYEGQHQI